MLSKFIIQSGDSQQVKYMKDKQNALKDSSQVRCSLAGGEINRPDCVHLIEVALPGHS